MPTRDWNPRPTDPRYIALDECATEWNGVGVTEYSVFVLTHANVYLKKDLCKKTTNTYKDTKRLQSTGNATRKKKKKVCLLVIRSHDLPIRSTLLQSNAPLFGPSVGV